MGFFDFLFKTFATPSASAPVSTTIHSSTTSHSSSTRSFQDENGFYDQYPQLYSSENDSNSNYSEYIFSGKFTKTGKMRTKRHIRIFKNEDILSSILALGYEQPIQFERQIPAPPTSAQMEYLYALASEHEDVVPRVLSCSDASALISRYVDHDRIPNPELFQYATEMHIGVSYYCGKRNLYDIVFHHLNHLDRSAFFIFCVYRDIDHSITGNLNQCTCKKLFYEFAESVKDNSKFQKSLDDNYYGADLRFFGSKYSKALGYSISGGSRKTTAYKMAKDFLSTHALIYS